MESPEDKVLFDMDFAEIEARIIAAMADDRLRGEKVVYGSVTGRLSVPLPPYHFPKPKG
jgi:hypothetical protein